MLRAFVLAWLALSASASAQDLAAGNFRLAREKVLRLHLGGRPLIAGDTLDYTPGFEQAAELIVAGAQGKQVLNVIQPHGDPVTYRKELALGPEGLELTVKYKLPAYGNDPDRPNIRYAFSVPWEILRGARWKARVGRAHAPQLLEGKAGARLRGIRYIAFRGEGLRLVFDFNPLGVCASGDYCAYGEPVGSWAMEREGDFVRFSFGYRAAFFGGVFMSKCLIFEGDYDYEARHAWPAWGYRGKTLPTRIYAFGTARPPKPAIAADLTVCTPAQGFGWRRAEGLRLVKVRPEGLVNNRVAAAGACAGEFLVDLVPGRWLATVRIAAGDAAIGPMSVDLDGRAAAEGLTVPAGEVRTVTAMVDHSKGAPLAIRFRGPGAWAASSIALQPLLYAGEDFTFARGLWNVEGPFTPK